ncbi:MAG: S8 family serine peptidase [Planctomycetota bacterium]|nr:S8 family serine peptidase [Planctomycetota bacterium]
MSSHSVNHSNSRHFRCETLEERLALTVDAFADFTESDPTDYTPRGETTAVAGLADPAEQIEHLRDQYAFDGAGQTVAVIDSGIAWDHYALGGGFGKDFRVVGGWDFAENDANPFDDGPSGFHGTHVAGIIGSDDLDHEGVAPAVDLVALRVFDDMGGGELEWVEEALRWVHKHRNDFENPITTINLSLGVDWNAETLPEWSTLEDEFAQLKKDGIFISVAAGNSFQEYRTKGVSYPAVSPHVVPVASHGDNGKLSDFSQRNNRVLVAPGENISSTIPAHLYGQVGSSTKFMAASGTSMAAPYLAGASVLLREAFDIAGDSNINQEFIYKHFRQTADKVYDSITHSWYRRFNFLSAIDAALNDNHGNSTSSATSLKSVSLLKSFEGILAKKNESDFFKFDADETGQVTLTVENSHNLKSILDVAGQQVHRDGNQISFQVTAGKQYSIRLHTVAGQGNYTVKANFESAMPVETDLGLIRSKVIENLQNSGESFHRLTASRKGILTVETLFQNSNGNIHFEIYNDSGELLGKSFSTQNGSRVDLNVVQGQSLIIKVIGNNDCFDFRLTNLVRKLGKRIIVGGTGQNDTYYYTSGNSHQVRVNGTHYTFAKETFPRIRINGGTGNDSVTLIGSSQTETLSGGSGELTFYGVQTDVIARGFETSHIHGNGGLDRAILEDSAAADFFQGMENSSKLTGGGYSVTANQFNRVTVISAKGGKDRAELFGSAGADFLHMHKDGTSLGGKGFQNYVIGFEWINAFGGAGNNSVIARGTVDNETFSISSTGMQFINTQGNQRFKGFDQVNVKSGGGNDQAFLAGIGLKDSFARNSNEVRGKAFGNEILIEDYDDVDWVSTVGQSRKIINSVVDQAFTV